MSHRKKGRSPDETSEIDLTPMLDVVFIMLIFFIVTASFVKEIGLDVNVPEPNENPPPPDADPNILIKISSSNQIRMGSAGQERIIDVRAIRSNIATMRAKLPQAAVIIQASEDADVGLYVAVADAARAAKVENVVLVPVAR